MAKQRRKRFGEILEEAGIITQDQLKLALEAQKNTKKSLGEILEEKDIISQKDIAKTLARQFGFKTVRNIADHSFPASILNLIDSQKALEKQIFPLKVEEKKLYLAMVNPLDIETLDTLSFATGLHITPIITTPAEIYAAINIHYLNIIDEVYDDSHWRILVIDSPQMVNVISGILQDAGYSVSTATTSADSLKIATHISPHLIVAETRLAEININNLYHTLKKNSRTQNCPIIGVSFRATADEEAKLLDMGLVDFIAKPINSVRLLARVKRVLHLLYQEKE